MSAQASTDPASVTRLVRKRASAASRCRRPDEPHAVGPDPADIRREVDVLSRCDAPGIVRLVGFGEHPVPWLETQDAGGPTMASPPPSATDRLAALAALTRVLANLHRLGWVHRSLGLDHVVWQERAGGPRGAQRTSTDIEITLCSLGFAVCPAGPAERAADREALAEIMASTIIAPATEPFRPEIRTSVAALVTDLKSGDLDDLAAVAAGLDDLVDAAHRGTDPVTIEAPSPARHPPARSLRRRGGRLARRFLPGHAAGAGLVSALVVVLLGGVAALALRPGGEGGAGAARAPRCSRPVVPPPRVDPDGSGCGQRAEYRSGVLTVGVERWGLGADIVDGRLVDLDGDGWSELAALREDGEVFLVRRFPAEAAERVQVRSVAVAPGARRLEERAPGIGLEGVEALDAGGKPRVLLPVSPGIGGAGSSSPPVSTAPAPRNG